MSNATIRNLSKEKIQQVLASIGSQKADDNDNDNVETAEYNWHLPHYFNSAKLKKLDNFTEKVAQNCTREFTQLYHADFEVTIVSTAQYFANQLFKPGTEQNDYCIAFGADQEHLFGLIAVPAQSAIKWTTQVLGGIEAEGDSERELSQLEKSLLLDIASILIGAFAKAYDDRDLCPAENVAKNQVPFELEGTEEFCKITFNAKKTDSENSSEAYFLISCEELRSVVGQDVEVQTFSAEDISNTMLSHVHKVPVSVTAQLASAVLTFEEAMSLSTGDIVLLDKKIDDPIEVIAKNQILFRGQPAKSAGKYAMVITEICSTK